MLISFSITNFRSFREEQTLSMVASNRQPDHLEHLAAVPGDENKVLPVGVIYGANGAGKSNFVKALTCLRDLVLVGTEPGKPIRRQSFLLDRDSKNQPSEFVVQFIADEKVLAYGVRVNDEAVVAEWLSVQIRGRELSVYERVTDAEGRVNIEDGPILKEPRWGNHQRILALTKVGVLPNQLFLHAVRSNVQEQEQGDIVRGALNWLTKGFTVVEADSRYWGFADLIANNKGFTAFASEFLRKVATGVDHLDIEKGVLSPSALAGMDPPVRSAIEELSIGKTATLRGPNGVDFVLHKDENATLHVGTTIACHLTAEGDHVDLPFLEESDGTQRVAYLLPALHQLGHEGRLFVIDEIDRSLHSLLAKGFVREFLKKCAGKGSQLIFTTHETAFLDLDLLRRDEIWFANKKRKEGTTELYSLADYKVRTDLKIDKAYLQGRFEAVPPIESELPDWVNEIIDGLKPKTTAQPEPVA